MYVHMMITQHSRRTRHRPLLRARAALQTRVRSLARFGDKDFNEVKPAYEVENTEFRRRAPTGAPSEKQFQGGEKGRFHSVVR